MSEKQLMTTQLLEQGRTARLNGDYDQAIAYLQRAIDEDSNLAEIHMELGLAYCFSGLFDESLQELLLAVQLDTANPEARLHLAKTYTMLGMYEEGAVAFRTVLGMTPSGDKFHDDAAKQLSYFEQLF